MMVMLLAAKADFGKINSNDKTTTRAASFATN